MNEVLRSKFNIGDKVVYQKKKGVAQTWTIIGINIVFDYEDAQTIEYDLWNGSSIHADDGVSIRSKIVSNVDESELTLAS